MMVKKEIKLFCNKNGVRLTNLISNETFEMDWETALSKAKMILSNYESYFK